MNRHALRGALVVLGLLICAGTVTAQSAVYVTGSGFADIKRFSTTDGIYYGRDDDEFSMDGTSGSGGLRVGTFLHPRWSLELAVDAGGRTESSTPFAVILADLPRLRVPELKQTSKFLTISGVVGYHPPAKGRIRLGYLFGFSFVRGTYKTDYPSYYLLSATNSIGSIGPIGPIGPIGSTASINLGIATLIYPPPVFTAQTITTRDNNRAAILGFESAFDVTRHLAIVPEIRALAFTARNSGSGIFLIRPGVGVRWSF